MHVHVASIRNSYIKVMIAANYMHVHMETLLPQGHMKTKPYFSELFYCYIYVIHDDVRKLK